MTIDTVELLLKAKKMAELINVAPSATVAEAVREMNDKRIGALLVMNGPQLAGIFTERDVLVRVVGAGRDPATTPVSEVMTVGMRSVEPATTIDEAMQLMSEQHFRHLPVLAGGRVQGLVSMRDITNWIIRTQQATVDGAIGAVKRMGMANRRGQREALRPSAVLNVLGAAIWAGVIAGLGY